MWRSCIVGGILGSVDKCGVVRMGRKYCFVD